MKNMVKLDNYFCPGQLEVKMEEFVRDAFQGSITTISADYLHINPKNYNVDTYATKRIV